MMRLESIEIAVAPLARGARPGAGLERKSAARLFERAAKILWVR